MNKLLIFDTMHLCYRNHYVFPKLRNSDGVLVGSIFGSLNSIESYSNKYPNHKMLFCLDTQPTNRKRIFPDYKANRNEKPEWYLEFITEVNILKKILKLMNVVQYKCEGYEADDIAYYLAEQYKKTYIKGSECIFITGDKDWLALVNDDYNISVIDPNRKIRYRKAETCEHYNIAEPNKVSFYKVLKGDSSDNIKGIYRIPTKLVIYVVDTYRDVNNLLVNMINDTNIPVKWRQQLDANRDTLYLNEKLIKLTDIKNPISKIVGKLNEEKLLEYYRELEFKSLIDKIIKNQFKRGLE